MGLGDTLSLLKICVCVRAGMGVCVQVAAHLTEANEPLV